MRKSVKSENFGKKFVKLIKNKNKNIKDKT